jgi:hypothetical protein
MIDLKNIKSNKDEIDQLFNRSLKLYPDYINLYIWAIEFYSNISDIPFTKVLIWKIKRCKTTWLYKGIIVEAIWRAVNKMKQTVFEKKCFKFFEYIQSIDQSNHYDFESCR